MRFYATSAAIAAAIAVMAAPAFAADPPAGTPDKDNNPGAVHKPDSTPPSNDGTGHKPDTPGPKADLPAKAKAYGRRCKDQSKKREEGEKGTPFSQCVTAMAKLATGKTASPRKACKELSKKHDEKREGHAVQPLRLPRREAAARPESARRRGRALDERVARQRRQNALRAE